jgi:hypothetical protein
LLGQDLFKILILGESYKGLPFPLFEKVGFKEVLIKSHEIMGLNQGFHKKETKLQ